MGKAPTLPPPPKKNEPLWKIPCRIIGVTGEVGEGKTWFSMLINPDASTTLQYDLEKSSESYTEYGCDRVDVYDEMARLHPKGYHISALWDWWVNDLRTRLAKKRYRLVITDPTSELEDALEARIRHKPNEYGLTASKVVSFPQLMWAAMKTSWKQAIMSDVASKVECFAFTVHMRQQYDKATKAATKKREPRGKETLMQIANLFLELRRPIIEGKKRGEPAAIVLKSRLAALARRYGQMMPVPVLPDRIPICTPAHIRWYMANPVGLRNTNEDEKIEAAAPMSEDEKLEMESSIANAKAEEARAKADAADKELVLQQRKEAIRLANMKDTQRQQHQADVTVATAKLNGELKATRPQCLQLLQRLRSAAEDQGMPYQAFQKKLEKRGAKRVNDLTDEMLRDLCYNLAIHLEMTDLADETYGEHRLTDFPPTDS